MGETKNYDWKNIINTTSLLFFLIIKSIVPGLQLEKKNTEDIKTCIRQSSLGSCRHTTNIPPTITGTF